MPDTPPPMVLFQRESGERISVACSPFRIGRRADNSLTLFYSDISAVHVELTYDDGGWLVADQGSTNGTFVNGDRISKPTRLQPGDMLHLGANAFQVVSPSDDTGKPPNTALVKINDAEVFLAVELVRVLANQLAYPYFQPIITLRDQTTIGWEVLGRAQTATGAGPIELFSVAETAKQAIALSDAFAVTSTACAECRHCFPDEPGSHLFLNVHPAQLEQHQLSEVVARLQESTLTNWYQIVIELPESLVCETQQMDDWMGEIRDAGFLVAYDDFGKGQSRLTDLLRVPPDFLKIDGGLIKGLGNEGPRHTLVKALVEACQALRVRTIAEGIETADDLQQCVDIGIDLGQGFLLCRPQPAYQLFEANPDELPEHCPFVRLGLVP